MKSNKDRYIKFCQTERSIDIFSMPWWLDTVCESGNWNVAIVYDGNQIIATMPYFFRKIINYKIITMPKLTQTLGPWIRDYNKYDLNKNLSKYKLIIQALIDQIPKNHYFYQQMSTQFSNWLPFYWNNYQQTTRYTYVIQNINREDIFLNFSQNKKRNIKKALDFVDIKFDLNPEIFYEHHKNTLMINGRKPYYKKNLYLKIINKARQNNSGFIISAHDKLNNEIHAALFIIYGKERAYYLINTNDQKYKAYGASSLLVSESIKYLKGKTKHFDFEGSMDFNINQSYRQFGALPQPYHSIKKINSVLIYIRDFIKNIR